MTNQDLRKAGLKATLPRLKILDILAESTIRHMTAEDISRILLESGEDIGLATIYRALTQFEAAGLIKRHHFESGLSVFELKVEDNHHDHLVCINCAKIEEFYSEEIEKNQIRVAEQAGFKMTDHSLNIYGFCSQCQSTLTV